MPSDHLNNTDSIIFCIDMSGSIPTSTYEKLKTCLIEMIRKLKTSKPHTKIMLVAFDSAWHYYEKSKKTCMKHKSTFEDIRREAANIRLNALQESSETLIKEIRSLHKGGGTFIWTALTFCLILASNPNSRLVIFTDGVTDDPNLDEYAKLFDFASLKQPLNIDFNVLSPNNCHPKLIQLIRAAGARIRNDFESIFNELEQENFFRNSTLSNHQPDTPFPTITSPALIEINRLRELMETNSQTARADLNGLNMNVNQLAQSVERNEQARVTDSAMSRQDLANISIQIRTTSELNGTNFATTREDLNSLNNNLDRLAQSVERNEESRVTDSAMSRQHLANISIQIRTTSELIERSYQMTRNDMNSLNSNVERLAQQNRGIEQLVRDELATNRQELEALKNEIRRSIQLIETNEQSRRNDCATNRQELENINNAVQRSFGMIERNDLAARETVNNLNNNVSRLAQVIEASEELSRNENAANRQEFQNLNNEIFRLLELIGINEETRRNEVASVRHDFENLNQNINEYERRNALTLNGKIVFFRAKYE